MLPSDQELVEICNQLTNTADLGNRSHSVPPLPQHILPRPSMQPLTPQNNNRHQMSVPRVTNVSGHVHGLKEIRDRDLHGDTNNNSSNGCTGTTPSTATFAAKRNLMSELENVTSSNAIWVPSGIHQTKLHGSGIPEINNDPLGGLTLEEFAAEAMSGGLDVFADPTTDLLFSDNNALAHTWNVGQPLTMDSCM